MHIANPNEGNAGLPVLGRLSALFMVGGAIHYFLRCSRLGERAKGISCSMEQRRAGDDAWSINVAILALL